MPTAVVICERCNRSALPTEEYEINRPKGLLRQRLCDACAARVKSVYHETKAIKGTLHKVGPVEVPPTPGDAAADEVARVRATEEAAADASTTTPTDDPEAEE